MGDEDERAVSPVIGVILMVAITVILAAVIAAFVLDLGDSVDQEAQSGASMTWDNSSQEMSIELTSEGNANEWQIRGDYYVGDDGSGTTDEVSEGNYATLDQAGDTFSLECVDTTAGSFDSTDDYGVEQTDETGTITVVASMSEDDSWTTVASEDWDCR
ncbi:type IV pilin N-terminal domain-containing protein [Halosolutus amylolyticus]|uniref:Type IV pilin N-terminal domain-containing protein n=1 Tax=Halosolutus amylolyticus TaxID=2932267 RepID=A0ABD5PL50_9EURY|nr:type IV pilin N-terminal domain-containing protein [Halosolutus amylolyticus]